MKKMISVCLAFLLLLPFTAPAFAAGENELTLDGMLEAFESGDKEALDVYFEALGVPTEVSQLESAIAPRWASSDDDEDKMCHESLTAYGVLLYLSSMQRMYGLQLSAMGYRFEDIQTLVVQVRKPDSNLALGFLQGFAGHFYSPETGFNFLSKPDNTAKTNLEAYYRTANSNYIRGDRTQAITDLAYAIHYLQDLNEPHHVSNITTLTPNNNHKEFEELASSFLLNEMADADFPAALEITDAFFYNYLNQPVGDSGHQAAVEAKRFITPASSKDKLTMQLAAVFTLSNAMAHTAGLLFRFAKDTHMIK